MTIVQPVTLLIVALLSSVSTEAYILPLDTILSKTVTGTTEQAGNTIIAVEQNVVFTEGDQEYIIKESWLIEGDKNLKLNAVGKGALKDLFSLHYLYNNKKRTHLEGKNKIVKEISPEFFERFLAIKSADSYRSYLKQQGIFSRVRLSRAAGAISFAIGDASSLATLSPQIWINQDFFHLSKIRFRSEADVEFSDYKHYGKENAIQYPSSKVINWGVDRTATVKVVKFSTKSGASIKDFYTDALDTPSEMFLIDKGSLENKVREFYTRFR